MRRNVFINTDVNIIKILSKNDIYSIRCIVVIQIINVIPAGAFIDTPLDSDSQLLNNIFS